MAILAVLHYPDPRLRHVANRVDEVTPQIQRLIDDMAETMYAAPGVGLAATQVGEPVRLFLADTADEGEPSDLRVFINPEIIRKGPAATGPEGCLSFPGVYEDVSRASTVTVRALDRDGKPFELEAEGLLAVAIQHEYDHLEGRLMIDYMGPLKKRLVHRKMLRHES